MQRKVFRPRYRLGTAVFFTIFAGVFLYATVAHSKVNALAGALAVGCIVAVYVALRRGLYVDSAGVRIVQPWRLRALAVGWRDIDRFEMRTGAGEAPVNLIRSSDQRAIAIPTFPRTRRDIDPINGRLYAGLRARIQAQVDELNLLREHYSTAVSPDAKGSALGLS